MMFIWLNGMNEWKTKCVHCVCLKSTQLTDDRRIHGHRSSLCTEENRGEKTQNKARAHYIPWIILSAWIVRVKVVDSHQCLSTADCQFCTIKQLRYQTNRMKRTMGSTSITCCSASTPHCWRLLVWFPVLPTFAGFLSQRSKSGTGTGNWQLHANCRCEIEYLSALKADICCCELVADVK